MNAMNLAKWGSAVELGFAIGAASAKLPPPSDEAKAKAAEVKAMQDSKDMASWSIFQLVHNRYKKLETMLYGRVERTNPSPAAATPKGF